MHLRAPEPEVAVQQRVRRNSMGGRTLGYGLANKLVLSKIKGALGLDRCKAAFTGAAPIAMEIMIYFASLDVPLLEIFGQSECTGPHTANLPGQWKIGSVGRPLAGTETRIDPGTGEIQYRGRHVFLGYLHMEEETQRALAGGWLHSGDVGRLDADGFLYITGRIKELIITAGGENIPPVLIEDKLKAHAKAVSNCMVVGDRRKYLVILLTLRTEVDGEGLPTEQLAVEALTVCNQIQSQACTVSQAAGCSKWAEYFDRKLAAANAEATSAAQRVQKWALLPVDFTHLSAVPELTPTLKLKRAVVMEKYIDVIEGLYA